MKLFINSKFKRLPLATLFVLCISLVWQSSAMAKKPVLEDPFFVYENGVLFLDDNGDPVSVFTEGEGLYLVGTEKLKLSKCDKPDKLPISVHLAFPKPEVIHIVAINNILLGTTTVIEDDPDTVEIETGTEFSPAPIIGTYTRKNKVWFNLDFGKGKGGNGGNKREVGSGFDLLMSRFEDWVEPYCEGEGPVTLTTKKTKFRLKFQEKGDGFKAFFFLNAKLRRVIDGVGSPKNGAGVAQIKAKGTPALFEEAVAPEPVI